MKYLLDTNIIIALQKRHLVLLERLKQHQVADLCYLTSCCLSCIMAYHSQKQRENMAKIERLPFMRLPFGDKDAICAGKVRADLAQKGQVIGAYEMLIAGQAIAQGLTLITHNVKEFSHITGLSWEDWLE